MNTKILDYIFGTEGFEKFLPIVIICFSIYLLTKFVRDNYHFYRDVFDINFNKKITLLKEDLESLNNKESLLKEIIQFQIENYIFSNLTKLKLNRFDQNKFLFFLYLNSKRDIT